MPSSTGSLHSPISSHCPVLGMSSGVVAPKTAPVPKNGRDAATRVPSTSGTTSGRGTACTKAIRRYGVN